MDRDEAPEAFDVAGAAKAWPHCPAAFLQSLKMYADHHLSTGGFLHAVLENDLAAAVNRSDPESLEALRSIVGVAYNFLPAACWGSRAKVAAWLTKDRARG